MAGVEVKQEYIEATNGINNNYTKQTDDSEIAVIDLDSSDDDNSSDGIRNGKRSRVSSGGDDFNSKRKKSGDGVETVRVEIVWFRSRVVSSFG
ncbi:hypothetical protein Hanom_Chr02g00172861 [Helianthus anomalus]